MTSSINQLSFILLNLKKKERGKITKLEYLVNKKKYLDEIKNVFYSF